MSGLSAHHLTSTRNSNIIIKSHNHNYGPIKEPHPMMMETIMVYEQVNIQTHVYFTIFIL